jgi:hypothetical protein
VATPSSQRQLIAVDHLFVDGNKRTVLMSTRIFYDELATELEAIKHILAQWKRLEVIGVQRGGNVLPGRLLLLPPLICVCIVRVLADSIVS